MLVHWALPGRSDEMSITACLAEASKLPLRFPYSSLLLARISSIKDKFTYLDSEESENYLLCILSA